mmetsp:Transcript_24506/g.38019  ORF Transcript_24506/g.38019 Transcript_24506/m.38019 type:complete len:87 (+) Transcript_24506:91-351(+)
MVYPNMLPDFPHYNYSNSSSSSSSTKSSDNNTTTMCGDLPFSTSHYIESFHSHSFLKTSPVFASVHVLVSYVTPSLIRFSFSSTGP